MLRVQPPRLPAGRDLEVRPDRRAPAARWARRRTSASSRPTSGRRRSPTTTASSNGDVSWGTGATTNGKIYANGNIDHDGIATADIFAEGQITGSVVDAERRAALRRRHEPEHPRKIKNPIDFTSFLTSFTDIERASQLAAGSTSNNASKAAWRLSFKRERNGRRSRRATGAAANDVADVAPDLHLLQRNSLVPANGAIYAVQDVIVRTRPRRRRQGTRVTVASNDDIIVADNIHFVTSGQDVLGLVAKNNVYIAKYTPDPLTWSAGVIAQTGTWRARDWSGTNKSLMTFRGMAATDDGGSFAGMFATRDYGYDESFLWLPPPWFPVVEDAYTVLFFRELPSGT